MLWLQLREEMLKGRRDRGVRPSTASLSLLHCHCPPVKTPNVDSVLWLKEDRRLQHQGLLVSPRRRESVSSRHESVSSRSDGGRSGALGPTFSDQMSPVQYLGVAVQQR